MGDKDYRFSMNDGSETMIQKVVIRHLKGARTGQIDEFAIVSVSELIIGRDPSNQVKFDPDRDDLVSRFHAKILQVEQKPTQFSIVDMESSNGTFVNGRKIDEVTKLYPGDKIRLGADGPELEFDIVPRPGKPWKQTRLAPDFEETEAGEPRSTKDDLISAGVRSYQPSDVSRRTVMNWINKSKYQSTLIASGVALALVLLIFLYYQFSRTMPAGAQEGSNGSATVDSVKAKSGTEIADANQKAVVFIRASWHLVYTPTREKVYHLYLPFQGIGIPIYRQIDGDRIVPFLIGETSNLKNSYSKPIGYRLEGTGFVVRNNGFILTNLHIGAPWLSPYPYELLPRGTLLKPTIQIDENLEFSVAPDFGKEIDTRRQDVNWIPTESNYFNGEQISQKMFEGKFDYLDVTFANRDQRIPANLARASNRHDVALLKIDDPDNDLPFVEVTKASKALYQEIKQGERIFVFGYPSSSPIRAAISESKELGKSTLELTLIPEPSMAEGIVGKIIRESETRDDSKIFTVGDYYELSGKLLGRGASGGPVFDSQGRVIAIYTAMSLDQDGLITSYAMPIKYGLDLIEGGTLTGR